MTAMPGMTAIPETIAMPTRYQRKFALLMLEATAWLFTRPVVWYGAGKTIPHYAASDISTTYQTSTTYNNHVVITDLQPDTTYNYRPACGNAVYSFTTAREIGKGTPFQFAMIGDMGTMGPDGLSTTVGAGAANPLMVGEKTTIDSLSLSKSEYDFVWHVGDIAYADAW